MCCCLPSWFLNRCWTADRQSKASPATASSGWGIAFVVNSWRQRMWFLHWVIGQLRLGFRHRTRSQCIMFSFGFYAWCVCPTTQRRMCYLYVYYLLLGCWSNPCIFPFFCNKMVNVSYFPIQYSLFCRGFYVRSYPHLGGSKLPSNFFFLSLRHYMLM
jgi:hypothetical protein